MRTKTILSLMATVLVVVGIPVFNSEAATLTNELVFRPEPQRVILNIYHTRKNQSWPVYMPTRLISTDSFQSSSITLSLRYKDSTWVEQLTPLAIASNKVEHIHLTEDHNAIWAPLPHGGEVEFHIYHTYVLVRSTKLTKAQLIAEANSESPVGG